MFSIRQRNNVLFINTSRVCLYLFSVVSVLVFCEFVSFCGYIVSYVSVVWQ